LLSGFGAEEEEERRGSRGGMRVLEELAAVREEVDEATRASGGE
jgi:hypothetical protein